MLTGSDARSSSSPASSRVRVAFVIDSLGHGGAERLLLAYLKHLPGLGIDPTVIALQDKSGNPVAGAIEDLGIPVLQLGIERLRQRGALQDVGNAIDRAAPDVVHTQLEFSNVLGAAAASRRGIPVTATLHTLEEPARWSRARLRMKLMAWSLRRHARRVIAVSEHARRHHLEHLGLSPGLVATIHNGIEIERFAPDPDARERVLSEFGIPAAARLIATVAVLRPPKGLGFMLRALPGVIEAAPDAHYLIVGDGEARADLAVLADDLGVTDRVTFSGARADVESMLAAADLFVLPSLTEALPTVIAEAMAAGLPVVATRVGGTPEMVDPGSGVLVPPGDAVALETEVARLLTDPGLSAALGERGREIAAERFDICVQAGHLAGVYHSLAGARR